jgi:lysozyme
MSEPAPIQLPKIITKLDQRGIDFIANEEGCILHPYKDSVSVWTIGYGNTYYPNGQRVKPTDKSITKGQALELFKFILQSYEKSVWSITRDDLTQNNFNALVSISYNIGVNGFKGSTLLKRVNANPKDPSIASAFVMWANAGSKKGILLERRKREAALYFS